MQSTARPSLDGKPCTQTILRSPSVLPSLVVSVNIVLPFLTFFTNIAASVRVVDDVAYNVAHAKNIKLKL